MSDSEECNETRSMKKVIQEATEGDSGTEATIHGSTVEGRKSTAEVSALRPAFLFVGHNLREFFEMSMQSERIQEAYWYSFNKAENMFSLVGSLKRQWCMVRKFCSSE